MRIVGLAIFRGMTQRISALIQHAVNQLFVLLILLQVKLHAINLVDDEMPLLSPLVNSWAARRIGTTDKGIEQLVDANITLMNGANSPAHIDRQCHMVHRAMGAGARHLSMTVLAPDSHAR